MHNDWISKMLSEINRRNSSILESANLRFSSSPISQEFIQELHRKVKEHEDKMMKIALEEGIAYPLSMPVEMLYDLEGYKKIDYDFWLNEDDTAFFSYLQEKIKNVYNNEYVDQQIDMMKNNDINLFVPFLMVLLEKLCRKVINKEPEQLKYPVIKKKLTETWNSMKDRQDIQKELHYREKIIHLYSEIFDLIIVKEIFAHELEYNKQKRNNYNRHIIMHARTDFDEFTKEKTAKLIFVILFLVDILELRSKLLE